MRACRQRFSCIGIEAAVAERAVAHRQTRRLRLPDAIILATAQSESALLVTRNSNDLAADAPGIRIPYTV